MISPEGAQMGIVAVEDALGKAAEEGLDLVEVAPNAEPPVCKIMDYGKYKYQQKKKQKGRGAHEITLKEVRLRPKTDDNDRRIKLNRAIRFLGEGHKVQFTMLFRGRERAHREVGEDIFASILEMLGEEVRVERPPRMEGSRMVMVISPAKH